MEDQKIKALEQEIRLAKSLALAALIANPNMKTILSCLEESFRTNQPPKDSDSWIADEIQKIASKFCSN